MAACPEEDAISAFARGDCSPGERQEIEQHIDVCTSCARVVADLVRLFGDSQPVLDTDTQEHTLPSASAEDVPDQVLPGKAIGRYRVLELVGVGGMGRVYAAYDPELDRRVAVKVLRVDGRTSSQGSGQRGRLQREAQAMARLAHPNVIAVHDVGLFEERVFVAMEFVAGGTLSAWQQDSDRTWSEVAQVYGAAGRGLAAAHAAGLVHRDFKPDNVLIGLDGRVRVTDFGLARIEEENSTLPGVAELQTGGESIDRTLTKTGALVGTPAYMAPEQFVRLKADAKSDQYSFCVALYEALWGKRPFSAGTLAELSTRVVNEDAPSPSRPAKVPLRVRRAVMRGLARDPEERWPSMDALLAQLRPSAGRMRPVLWASAAVIVGGGVLALGREAPAKVDSIVCSDSELAEVWNPRTQEGLRQGFEGTKAPFATRSFEAVDASVSTYVEEWSQLAATACGPNRESDEALLTRVCLSSGRDALEAVLEVLTIADRKLVAGASGIEEVLPRLEPCRDPTTASSRRATPPNLAIANDVSTGRTTLAKARASLLVGRPEAALEACEEVERVANAVGYVPLLAEALTVEGRALIDSGRYEDAARTLTRSMQRAIESHHSSQAIEALLELLYVRGHHQGQLEAADHVAAQVEAEINAADAGPRERATLSQNLAATYFTAGKYDVSLTEAARAVELRRTVGRTNRLADALSNLAAIEFIVAKYDDAEGHFAEASELYLELFGPSHPQVAALYENRGQLWMATGQFDRAREDLERALEIRREAMGPDHADLAHPLMAFSTLLSTLGEHDEAIAGARQSLHIKTQSIGPDHPRFFSGQAELTQILYQADRLDEAQSLIDDTLVRARKAIGPDHPIVAEILHQQGQVLMRRERYAEAAEVLVAAEAAFSAQASADAHAITHLHALLCDAYFESGQYAEVSKVLERALPAAKDSSAGALYIPPMKLLGAVSKWELGEDRAAARQDVEAAIPTLEETGQDAMVSFAKTWLDEHPVD